MATTGAPAERRTLAQGYLPAVIARNYLDFGMIPDADILTGPAIIDISNLEKTKYRLFEVGLS